jgi:hypothetical protein
MSNDSKVLRWGAIVAAAIIVFRIILEQLGASEQINRVLGVAWLYFILPVLFAIGIRAQNVAKPYGRLLKDVVLFAIYTRVMVMATYMLAYVFSWKSPRFAYPGGTVGENVSVWNGIFWVPLRNVLIWVVMATIIGMIIGSVTLLLKRKGAAPASA